MKYFHQFKPDLLAPALFKERALWCIYLGALFFLLYGAANQYAALSAPHPSIAMNWERSIPFIPLFIIPYMASDLMFIAAFALKQSRLELKVLAARVLFIILLSVLGFVLFPLQFSFVKPPTTEYAFLFQLLQADLPFNQLPSLHVSFAIIIWDSMQRHFSSKAVKLLLGLWFVLIVLSTLFTYQHHFWDLPSGALVGLAAIIIIPHNKDNHIIKQFSTPRHLKMALYYLVGTILLLILSFKLAQATPVWLYLALSTLSVSIIYAFGLSNWLSGKDCKPNTFQWFLFLPYYVGTYLSWRWYSLHLKLNYPFSTLLFIGRQPKTSEYALLKQIGIKHIINLAAEHPFQTSALPQTRFALLDMTIPSPSLMHKIVMTMEQHSQEKTYLHCALGLARTGIILGSYLLYKGYKLNELETLIQQAQPQFQAKPYIQVAWDLYADYLRQLNSRSKEFD